MKTRRLTALLLALCLLATLLPHRTFAAETASGTCGENLTWVLTQTGKLTVSGTGPMYDFTSSGQPWKEYSRDITTVIVEEGITSVGDYAFFHGYGLVSVKLPDSLTRIGQSAFFYCRNLPAVELPAGLTTLEDNAFGACYALTKANLPDGLVTIGSGAFSGCLLTEAVVPDGVTSIGAEAFSGCPLTIAQIPQSVTYIGLEAFRNCAPLSFISVAAENPAYCNDDQGALYNKDRTTLIVVPAGYTGEFVIPGTVQRVEVCALRYCAALTAAYIPDSVTEIGASAFYGCVKLDNVVLPDSLTTISKHTFGYCESLTSITIPGSVTTIGDSVFSNCISLTGVELPEGLTALGSRAFGDCTALTAIVIPEGITELSSFMFINCDALEAAVLPEGITALGSYCFGNCVSLREVDLPDALQTIANSAFSGCTALTELTVPANVTFLGGHCFSGAGLKVITFLGAAPAFENDRVFQNVTATAYYPGSNATWTEEVMLNYGGTITWVPYGETVERFKLVGASMVLGNELAMNFYVKTADLEGTDYYAEIVKTYADGRESKVITVPYDQWITNGSNKRFSFNGIAAKEMADEIYVTIYKTDGTQASEIWEDSVSAYVRRSIAKLTGENLTMGIDMLNYGAAAQEYFDYNEDDLANAGLEEYQKYATPDVTCVDNRVKGANYYGTTLVLESNIMLTMYFRNINTDMHAVVTFTDHYGKAKSITIPGSEFKRNGSYYGVVINALAVADARQLVTCKVYDAAGNEVASAVDSVESYVFRASSQGPLYQKIINFSVGAYNYFH